MVQGRQVKAQAQAGAWAEFRDKAKATMGGPFAAGAGGSCICPNCGATSAHVAGQPCNAVSCPDCGTKMIRG
jgi:hypothetical protein